MNIKDVEIGGAAQGNALIKDRIFNKHLGDDESTGFGTYRSASYKKKRERNNLQSKQKDLQFTSEFRKDLDIGDYKGKVALGFSKDRSVTIADAQEKEKQINTSIFSASEAEAELVLDFMTDEFDKLIDECLAKL